MRRLYKTNYGAASPLEFSIASVALITTLAVVTASMAPPVEQGSAQISADANAKATEIMSLLLTSDSEAGLGIDPETSVPVPPTGSITDITISNSPPYEPSDPSPLDGAIDVSLDAVLSWTGGDPDPDDHVTYDVYFEAGDPDPDVLVSEGQSDATFDPGALDYNTHYYWKIVAKDDYDHSTTGSIWDFTTESAPSNNPPGQPDTPSGPPSGSTGTLYGYSTSADDPDGDMVKYGWDWDDDSPIEWDDNGSHYYESGVTITTYHSWELAGIYYVKVMAEDIHGTQGIWSHYLAVGIKSTGGIGTCFLTGTQILMADGSQKNIENIRIDDMVASYDEKTDTLQKDKVTEIYHDTPDQMISDYYLIVNNDLKVTPDHHLYINNEWIQAGDLKIGDQLFKGKIISLEKIYEKVPSYNFETEKYHTYLVVFGSNIVIAHNGRNYAYILTGNDEEVSLSRQNSVTENDYTALLSMDRIYELSEIPYQELKEIFSISDEYEFFIKIENSESIFLNIIPDQTIYLDSANAKVTCRENVIIVDSAGYAYATITVTVLRY